MNTVACSDDGSKATESTVAGTVLDSSGATIDLTAGAAYDDDGEAGALRVILSSFSFSCADLADGLGFNTPPGGVYIGFYPDGDDAADLFEGDGTRTDLKGQRLFTASAMRDGSVSGEITLDNDQGTADFTVEHCGSLDPFGS